MTLIITAMARVHSVPHHFEAMIRILRLAESGRPAQLLFNSVRWDFAYTENQPPGKLYAIHLDFCDAHGDSLAADQSLPIGIEIPARIVVRFNEMDENLHRSRIREGVRFYCHERGKRIAEGRVTRVTGLMNKRPTQ